MTTVSFHTCVLWTSQHLHLFSSPWRSRHFPVSFSVRLQVLSVMMSPRLHITFQQVICLVLCVIWSAVDEKAVDLQDSLVAGDFLYTYWALLLTATIRSFVFLRAMWQNTVDTLEHTDRHFSSTAADLLPNTEIVYQDTEGPRLKPHCFLTNLFVAISASHSVGMFEVIPA